MGPRRRRGRPAAAVAAAVAPLLLLLLVVFLLSCNPATSREADDRSRFLYAEDPSASIILEYQLHNAPSEDYSGREEAAKEQPGSEYDEERHLRPYFLTAENGPRVVQYYSPWCGHCQSFKAKYISLAKEVERRSPEEAPEVHFHAVSCSVYHWVCMQNNVKGFPTIVAFEADSAVPHQLMEKDMTAESIAEVLGIQLNAPTEVEESDEDGAEDGYNNRPVDILGASLNSLARTRDTVFRDAALSFTHALKTEIFPEQPDGQPSGPLDSAQQEVFSDWIDLLYWALPPTWILHTLINDIRNNIDTVMMSQENLQFMVEKHRDVIHGANDRWSDQCRKSDERAGYSCGLWSLLHITTIGVMERHRAVLGAREQVSTAFVAKTMRNYIANFFECEQCREYFVAMFDSCGFKHCRRLRQPQKLPPKESWRELALWLWEVHNDVNVKKTEAQMKRDGERITREKLDLAKWPPEDECETCRDGKGKWDNAAILANLKKEYWPAGVQNFRYVVLKKKDNSKEEPPGLLSVLLENIVFLGFSAAFVMWCTRKRYISLTGRHKKVDQEYHV